MNWTLSGFKTYFAAAGAIGMAVYLASQGDYQNAISWFIGGLATAGIGHKLDKAAPAPADHPDILKMPAK